MANKKQIVIVDDDEDLLKLLQAAFEEKGFVVHTETTGRGALAYLTPENIKGAALLILDRMLPDMDGLAILKRANIPKELPVLILSILASQKDILEGLSLGAVDYAAKPFNLAALVKKALALL